VILVGAQKTRMPTGTWTVKARLMTLGNWTRGHSGYLLATNVAIFCPCPETLREVEFKGDRLIHLVEGILRQPSTQAVARYCQLL
jgi:hypothetical protein